MRELNISGKKVKRETAADAADIFSDVRTVKMINKNLKIILDHCKQYPAIASARTVTIKISLSPLVEESDFQLPANSIYHAAELKVRVGSPALPETAVSYTCAVNDGIPYYSAENPRNPEQLTFRDMGGDNSDQDTEYVKAE